MRTADTVAALARPIVEGLGFTLEDVEYQKEQGNWVLTLYIDREGGVTIDDCETVSRAVDPALDEADPIKESYYLSVSSLGLDRPLKKPRDFERNMGKELEIKLYAPVDGKKEYRGVLLSYDDDGFTIAAADGERTFPKKSAALVRPYIEF